MPPKPPIVLPAAASAARPATVIFIHGLGDQGEGWRSFATSVQSRQPHLKFILPNAPTIPTTINGGYQMPAWYDVLSRGRNLPPVADKPLKEDGPGIKASVNVIQALIDSEVASGTPEDRVVVGGFSQGSLMALTTGLLTKTKIAGVVALSGYVGLRDELEQLKGPDKESLPFFIGHGDSDMMVHVGYAADAIATLSKHGIEGVDVHYYPGMGHSTCIEERDDVESFLAKIVPA